MEFGFPKSTVVTVRRFTVPHMAPQSAEVARRLRRLKRPEDGHRRPCQSAFGGVLHGENKTQGRPKAFLPRRSLRVSCSQALHDAEIKHWAY